MSATWELLDETGYSTLTIEGVAARAGVGKATIYRWWPSKGALVAEAIATHLDHGSLPDTGDPRADLRRAIQIAIDNYSGSVAGTAIPAMMADLTDDAASYDLFNDAFLTPRRAATSDAILRAIDHGLLAPDTNVPLLLDLWAGAIFYRVLISREPIGPGLADEILNITVPEAR